jgi:hypothetical protein
MYYLFTNLFIYLFDYFQSYLVAVSLLSTALELGTLVASRHFDVSFAFMPSGPYVVFMSHSCAQNQPFTQLLTILLIIIL